MPHEAQHDSLENGPATGAAPAAGTVRPLRVLVVTNMYPTAERPSRGIFVQSQVEALRRSGEVEIDLAAFSASGAPWRYAVMAARFAPRGRAADLVHAHYGLSGLAALRAAAHTPLILTVHGRDCHHPLVRPVTAFVGRRAAAVVAVSHELAGLCPVAVAEVIPPGVDLRRFQPLPRAEARRRLSLDPLRRVVLFPADPRRPEKRYDLAKALISGVPGVDLRAYDNVPTDRVPLLVNAADAVIVTSDREGYGLACMEALACDVPVLSTPVGIAREVLPGVAGTLCARFDLALWRSHLKELLADPDPHVAGRHVAARQSTDVMARRTIALYRRVLRRAAG
jgi:glycosyltransferase involved in cell wall biosynthesis